MQYADVVVAVVQSEKVRAGRAGAARRDCGMSVVVPVVTSRVEAARMRWRARSLRGAKGRGVGSKGQAVMGGSFAVPWRGCSRWRPPKALAGREPRRRGLSMCPVVRGRWYAWL